MLPTMFSFRGHVTTGTLTLQRFLSSTKSIIERKSANVNLRPFRKQLELIYEEDHYPSLERREIVAQDLGVPMKSLSRWFIYRRTTDKNTRSLHGQDTSIFRHRELCTNEQKKILRDQCARNLYPNDSEIVLLAERLGMDKKRIGTKLLVNLR
ncbi:hypothetical protein CPB85DRAFT_236616 [Mucidula mucida]|nr:hypothetical protein CPB85DRAFT_236616 [Mucidula mucida]